MNAKDRTRLLKARVEAHFHGRRSGDALPTNEYLVLREVSADDAGEFVRRRRVDVVAVGIWKRTKHAVHGIETKVSRADWLAELRDPLKAAAGAEKCHAWWVAVDDPAIVRDGELPEGWGLLVPSGRGLKRAVEATLTERDLDPRWVAAIVAAASTQHSTCRGWVRMQERHAAAVRERDLRSEINRLHMELSMARAGVERTA